VSHILTTRMRVLGLFTRRTFRCMACLSQTAQEPCRLACRRPSEDRFWDASQIADLSVLKVCVRVRACVFLLCVCVSCACVAYPVAPTPLTPGHYAGQETSLQTASSPE
jgi:hypothetical protein